jgi:phosphohistidine swiveling domain-containing protein
MTTLAEPTPIATPEDFPVEWDDPSDAALHWTWDQMHMPRPISPLGRDLMPIGFATGMTAGLRESGAPLKERRLRFVNTFLYAAMIPDLALLSDTPARMQAIVAERGPGMYQRWLDVYLPEVQAANERLRSYAYTAASDTELRAFIDDTLPAMARMWEIHFLLMPGFMISAGFKNFCTHRLGLTALEAFEMMQGAPNMSVESGSALWRLAHGAPATVQDVIATQSADDALAHLRETDEGRAFLAALGDYLAVYGWRKGHFDVIGPAWAEAPALALDQVRLLLRVPTDPAEDQQRGAERSEQSAAACRQRLADDPAALAEFDALYRIVKRYPQLQENHNFYIDQTFMALLRLPFLEAGRRMAARGLIDDAEEYAYLRLDEIRDALGGNTTPHHDAVAERRAEMERWQTYLPPQAIGTQPPDGAATDFESDFFGAPVVPSRDPQVVQGLPGSRGVASGVARVVRTLAESDRIGEGDILVCEMTTPAWTPLFAGLVGIVADSGGPLSHCAIVAREFGIPAVVGTRLGTRMIPDGARITIDGGQGVVRIES